MNYTNMARYGSTNEPDLVPVYYRYEAGPRDKIIVLRGTASAEFR